jgi:hypothetical protein
MRRFLSSGTQLFKKTPPKPQLTAKTKSHEKSYSTQQSEQLLKLEEKGLPIDSELQDPKYVESTEKAEADEKSNYVTQQYQQLLLNIKKMDPEMHSQSQDPKYIKLIEKLIEDDKADNKSINNAEQVKEWLDLDSKSRTHTVY